MFGKISNTFFWTFCIIHHQCWCSMKANYSPGVNITGSSNPYKYVGINAFAGDGKRVCLFHFRSGVATGSNYEYMLTAGDEASFWNNPYGFYTPKERYLPSCHCWSSDRKFNPNVNELEGGSEIWYNFVFVGKIEVQGIVITNDSPGFIMLRGKCSVIVNDVDRSINGITPCVYYHDLYYCDTTTINNTYRIEQGMNAINNSLNQEQELVQTLESRVTNLEASLTNVTSVWLSIFDAFSIYVNSSLRESLNFTSSSPGLTDLPRIVNSTVESMDLATKVMLADGLSGLEQRIAKSSSSFTQILENHHERINSAVQQIFNLSLTILDLLDLTIGFNKTIDFLSQSQSGLNKSVVYLAQQVNNTNFAPQEVQNSSCNTTQEVLLAFDGLQQLQMKLKVHDDLIENMTTNLEAIELKMALIQNKSVADYKPVAFLNVSDMINTSVAQHSNRILNALIVEDNQLKYKVAYSAEENKLTLTLVKGEIGKGNYFKIISAKSDDGLIWAILVSALCILNVILVSVWIFSLLKTALP